MGRPLKYTIKNMQDLASKRGLEKTGVPGKCLSKKYLGVHTKLKWQCGKCENIWITKPYHIQQGSWCPKCAGKLLIEDKKELARVRGIEESGILGRYMGKNESKKDKWQCGKCGYIWYAPTDRIKDHHWCPKCAGNPPLTLKDLQKLSGERGLEVTGKPGRLISKKAQGARFKYEWQCGKCGHKWKAMQSSVKQGSWCPVCSQGYLERICRGYFEHIFKNKFPTTQLSQIIRSYKGKMHLDGYNYDLNLGFEYQGEQHYKYIHLYYRNEGDLKRQQERDKLKKELCKKNDVLLIIVPYWVKPNDMQDFIIKKYKQKSGIPLSKLPKYDHRSFFSSQNSLDSFF